MRISAMQLTTAAVALPLLLLSRVAAAEVRTQTRVTPVQKVITLLSDMLTKGNEEKHSEQVQYASYRQFCDDTIAEKQRLISSTTETIAMLKADIQKLTSDAELLTEEISGHDADIAAWEGDVKASAKVREIERADYITTHDDYSETIDALQRATATLKQIAERQHAQAPVLAEVAALKHLKLIPDSARRTIETFLQGSDEMEQPELDVSAPEAAAYEFQSSGVVDLLERLHDKFLDERTQLETEETNARHSFEIMAQDLRAQTSQASSERVEKVGAKAKKLQASAEAQASLQDMTTTRDADERYERDLRVECQQKASDFEARQQLRTEELQVIQQAIEILSSNTVAGASDRHLPTLLQSGRKSLRPSLLQRASLNGRSPEQERAAEFLKMQAGQLNSRILSTIATRVADDPFTKVKKLIKDLVVRLMEEANQEAEHKGWCDTELATNEQTRQAKANEVTTLHAEIDQLTASLSTLQEDIASLTQAIADLDAAMSQSTQVRQEERATNEATIRDSSDAQTAVAQATVVLRQFYVGAGEAVALAQREGQNQRGSRRQAQPAIFDSPYQGMQAQSGGVVGLLEVIQSDFARLQTETEGAESTAQSTYDQFMTDSQVDKAQKERDIQHKQAQQQNEEQALTNTRADLQGTQKELDASMEYYDKLKPSCVDAGVDYDDRVARRKEEIESLQEALRILNGEEMF
jgi:hypothetical protein